MFERDNAQKNPMSALPRDVVLTIIENLRIMRGGDRIVNEA
jgi:hypothetical protein